MNGIEIKQIPPVCKCSRQDERIERIERRLDAMETLVLVDVAELQRIRQGILPLLKSEVETAQSEV